MSITYDGEGYGNSSYAYEETEAMPPHTSKLYNLNSPDLVETDITLDVANVDYIEGSIYFKSASGDYDNVVIQTFHAPSAAPNAQISELVFNQNSLRGEQDARVLHGQLDHENGEVIFIWNRPPGQFTVSMYVYQRNGESFLTDDSFNEVSAKDEKSKMDWKVYPDEEVSTEKVSISCGIYPIGSTATTGYIGATTNAYSQPQIEPAYIEYLDDQLRQAKSQIQENEKKYNALLQEYENNKNKMEVSLYKAYDTRLKEQKENMIDKLDKYLSTVTKSGLKKTTVEIFEEAMEG